MEIKPVDLPFLGAPDPEKAEEIYNLRVAKLRSFLSEFELNDFEDMPKLACSIYQDKLNLITRLNVLMRLSSALADSVLNRFESLPDDYEPTDEELQSILLASKVLPLTEQINVRNWEDLQ